MPEVGAVGGNHAGFANGGGLLISAEAPSSHISESAHGQDVDAGAMDFGGVFDHGDAVDARLLEDNSHNGGAIDTAGMQSPVAGRSKAKHTHCQGRSNYQGKKLGEPNS